MTRLAPLFKVESFRNTVRELLDLSDEQFAAFRDGAMAELTATFSNEPVQSSDQVGKRALGILYEAAVRDGIDGVEAELRAAFPDEDARIVRLIAAINPGPDDTTRIKGIEERDGYLPILTSHRLALDLRVTDAADDTVVATPFVTVRMEFDSPVSGGVSAVVFQLNLAELEPLERALAAVRARAGRLVAASADMSIPGWGHGLPTE
ncbi:hypothetical protein [Microbacterium lacus]|uniref:Uncharacterized protein n=1 Tax=Microbacterium lacus TaxID=415217 RepID=A0ABN2FY03_9MICO